MRRGYELRLMVQRAETLHRRASDLFNMVDGSCGAGLRELAGDTMCSAAELAGALRRERARAVSQDPAPVGRHAKRHDRSCGHGPKDEHAVTAKPAGAQGESA